MKLNRYRISGLLSRAAFALFFLLASTGAYAEEPAQAVAPPAPAEAKPEKTAAETDAWFDLRFYGIDFGRTVLMESFPSLGRLEILTESGGGIIGRNYYRLPDGSRRAEPERWPGLGAPTSEAALRSLAADIWLRLTQFIDEGERFRAFAFARSRIESNLAADADVTPSLFAAARRESAGTFENSIGVGAGFSSMKKPAGSWSREGLSADLCYELSLDLFPSDLSTAFVHEVSGEFSGFFTLYSSDRVRLALREHVLASALLGAYVPEARLSSLGGNRYLPYWALGGIVRGVPDNACDGRLKAADNLELALTLPKILKGFAIPTLAAFVDAGIADDGAFNPDPGTFRLTTGAYLNVEVFGFNVFGGAAVNVLSGWFGPILGVGAHF